MTWPVSDVNTTNTDADADSPLSARADFADLIAKFNQIRNHVSAFIQTVLDDASASAARTTLGATATGDALYTAASAAAARTTLGVTATGADTAYAFRANNLSDLANVATARTNLGVTATGADTTYAYRANNLSDLANVATARSNLGVSATGADTSYSLRAMAAHPNSMQSADTRNTNYAPQDRDAGFYADLKANTADGLADGGTFHGVLTFRRSGAGVTFTEGPAAQIAYTDNGNLHFRISVNATTWGSWLQLYRVGGTDVAVADGGTGGSDAATARTNLGVTATGADTAYAFRANNLSDLASAATARTNLGVTATGADTTYAYRANNLSDLANVATARTNLGVTATGADTTYAFRANNLSDLGSAATARTNLGLGTVAVKSFPLQQNIYVPAGAMVERITNGAVLSTVETTTNKIMVRSLDFDAATQQYAQFNVTMPKNWDEGTVKARFIWRAATGTGNVVWGIQGVAISDGDALDAAFGTAVEVTDALIATADLMQSAETGAITIGGTPVARDTVVFQVYRNAPAAGDTFSASASLIGVEILYNIDDLTSV
jgi:hypothetical protein